MLSEAETQEAEQVIVWDRRGRQIAHIEAMMMRDVQWQPNGNWIMGYGWSEDGTQLLTINNNNVKLITLDVEAAAGYSQR